MRRYDTSLFAGLGSPWSLFPLIAKKDSHSDMRLLENTRGELNRVFQRIRASESEKREWISLWFEMDTGHVNRVSYRDFALYFNLGSNIWIERLFAIINRSLTGIITFLEFLQFCLSYLCIDQLQSMEFSYRLLSLSSGNFDPNKSVLNIYDIKQFITYRYNLKASLIHKRSIELVQFMDKDSSGGLSLSEFQLFCKNNLTFMKFSHILVSHLRKCIFGYDYWIEKSRITKMLAINSQYLLISTDINSENEEFDKTIDTPYEDLLQSSALMKRESSSPFRLSSKIPCNNAVKILKFFSSYYSFAPLEITS